ncbi:hypothetical protein UFOVP78_56 [uncultured Caudovirales phage]|uniref:Uncharacterized protein n=1 Tax=uncultured Caudovirales phage TaxID=2100421 RepID=A0A6J5L0M7_9CAUD|nr:hypothetical protein UFOVP78_56 [uncultured Caudovirales phage]
MDLLDVAPTLPGYTAETEAAIIAGRRPTMGEYLGASVREGYWNTTTGALSAYGEAEQAGKQGEALTREAWRASPQYREGLSYDERMTTERAVAMARTFDDNRYRRAVLGARDAGALETALGFGGQLLGSVPDPVNFLPFAGSASRGMRIGAASLEADALLARGLNRAATAMEAPGVTGGLFRGAFEGAAGNLAAAPAVYSAQAYFGDEVTFDRVVADIAMGALVGGGFGAAGGLLGRVGSRLNPDAVAAVRVLDAAAADLAAGRRVEVPPDLAVSAVNDAIIRSAPPEAAPFIRTDDAGRQTLGDLPTRPDGAPLSREELADVLAQRGATEELRGLLADIERRRAEGTLTPEQARGVLETVAGLKPTDRAPTAAENLAAIVQKIEERITAGTLTPEQGKALVGQVAEVRARSTLDDAHRWYTEALTAQQHAKRLAAAPPDAEPRMPDAAQRQAGKDGKPAAQPKAAAPGKAEAADPELTAAMGEVEQMRAEGRFTPADEAALKVGDEAAAEAEAIAKGLEEAAVCMMARMA